MSKIYEDSRTLRNSAVKPLQVWFEPWGAFQLLLAGETFQILVTSSQKGSIEIVEEESQAAVYAWPGSTMKVYVGNRLVEDFSIVVPELPPNLSMKSFVGTLFGGPGGPTSNS